ncbi:hypothetical protein DdX_17557 [Ditylenchus destructor]|uniref:Uncharacterized protein n=1 Tax=Ditylenchus destructor TaxID=166010 RepID=A0AAD4MLG6_9BILA|nr:hypothetical protein DdX_17557 [Ditylenchus destructor]
MADLNAPWEQLHGSNSVRSGHCYPPPPTECEHSEGYVYQQAIAMADLNAEAGSKAHCKEGQCRSAVHGAGRLEILLAQVHASPQSADPLLCGGR